MPRSTLTISLPPSMKQFIEAKLRQGQFSTPSEYIRSLIRDDQDLNGSREMAVLLRRGMAPADREVVPPPRNSRLADRDKEPE